MLKSWDNVAEVDLYIRIKEINERLGDIRLEEQVLERERHTIFFRLIKLAKGTQNDNTEISES